MLDGVYTPSPWAQRYHACMAFEVMGAGAAGVGKSVALVMDPASNIITEHKRCETGEIKWGQSLGRALHLRRREATLDQSVDVALRFYRTMFPDLKYYKSDRIIEFPTGYQLRFSHCYNTYDYNNYMSNAYDHIAFDELIEFEKLQYDNISRRCRTPDPVLRKMRRVRAMSNPYQVGGKNDRILVEDPFWVRRYFVDPAPQGGVLLKRKIKMGDGTTEIRERMYLPGRLSDNPDQDFARDFEATLRTGGAHIRKPLLEGDWYYTAGSFFDDWDGRLHVCDPFRIPSTWARFRSLDWGFKTYGAVLWFAQDEDGNLYCEKEFSYRNMTVDELCRNVMIVEKELGVWGRGKSLLTGPADHDLWEERGNVNTEPKIVTCYRHGIRWVKANKRDPMANAQLFIKRLRDHNEGTTTPGVVFFNTCKRCITTIPSIQTSSDNPEEPARGGPDHWYKAASYACAYASGVRRDGLEKESDAWDEDENYRYEPKGSNYGYGIRY